ncbi:MAG TPA: hypothetical protein VFS20_26975, partial [Longimicrobium sp.]|nr:hypothetical protein [Longimicrobium sp.]
ARSISRGTVQGHDAVSESGESVRYCVLKTFEFACQTWDYWACGDTQYLDCTMGCTDFGSCMGPGTCEFK